MGSQFGAPFTPGPCPPVTSPTATQSFAFSAIAASGSFQIQIGAVILDALNFNLTANDLQAQLNKYLPGSVAQVTTPANGPISFSFFFQPDVLVMATIINNTLKDNVPNPVNVNVTPQLAQVNPNYAFLTQLWQEFIAVDPTTVPAFEVRIMAIKTAAQLFVGPDAFKEATCYATFLIIAHIIKLSKRPTGYVTSEKAGDLAETYTSDKYLDLTVYGQEFRRLRTARILPGFMAGSNDQTARHQNGPLQGGFF